MGLSELEESSLSLDETLLRFMDQLELLEQKRATFNSLIEEGWFSLSKARYSMGNKQVSALQYASEIEPLVCVQTRILDNGEVDFSTEKTAPTSCNEKDKAIEDVGPQEEGIRRRTKPNNKEIEESSSAKSPQLTSVRKSDQSPQQDPLKWFGILTPQSLKHAQTAFKQVIELSAEIANLQTAVSKTRQELKDGIKNKHILQEKSSAAQLDTVAD
ncbi:uncharacterized protein V6R79_011009 [Siganus canaliculatus]